MSSDAAKPLADLVRSMLSEARPTSEELHDRVHGALNAQYWESLNPSLTVGRAMTPDAPRHEIDPAWQKAIDHFRAESYARLPDVLTPSHAAMLSEAIAKLREARWPAVFAFVYDQFWLCARSPAIVALLQAALGDRYQQLPHVWT